MEVHIDNPSNHRFYWRGGLMDSKKKDDKIQVNIYFGNEKLHKIIDTLIDTKLSLWAAEYQDELKYNSTNYTTVNHTKGVIAE